MAKRKKSKADLLKCYRDDIDVAKRFRRKEQYDELWRRMNDLYRGRHFPEDITADDAVVINIAFATINVIGPSVSINYPKTVVTAVNPEDEDKATILEEVVNYWWRKYDVLSEFQLAVKDYLMYGFGWIKTGYRFEESEVPRSEDEIQAEFEQTRAQIDSMAVADPEGPAITDDEILEVIPRTRKVTEFDAPFVERVSVHDIFVDPEATSMRDARWIAQRVVMTLDELHEAGYPRYIIEKAKADSRADENYFTNNPWAEETRVDNEKMDRYTVWEFYDLAKRQMSIFPDVGDGYFVEPTPMPYQFGHPFVMLRNYDIPDVFYPMGELEALEPLQHELNLTRSAMFNDRKQYRRAWVYKPEAFDALGRAALESDEDNRLIPISGNLPLDQAIAPLPTQQVNPQLYQDSGLIESDITNITGINDYMRGALPEIRRTATEAAIIQDIANARAADKLAKVEKAVGEISRRLVILAQQYMTEEQVARVVSVNTPRPVWFKYSPEDIEGEFDFTVEGGSTQPQNDTMRRQAAIELLQALAPFGDPMMGLVNMQAVIAHALKEGFGIKDVGKFMGQGPMQPPMPPDGGAVPPDGGPPADEAAMLAMMGAAPPEPTPTPMDVQMAAGDQGGGAVDPMLAQLAGQVGLSI